MCVCVLIIMHNGVLCIIPSYICMNYYTLIKKNFRASHGYATSIYETRRHCQLSAMWHIWQCLQINMCHPTWTNNTTCQNFIGKAYVEY